MRIGPAAHIKMRLDRNVWFQGSSGLRQGAIGAAISSHNRTSGGFRVGIASPLTHDQIHDPPITHIEARV